MYCLQNSMFKRICHKKVLWHLNSTEMHFLKRNLFFNLYFLSRLVRLTQIWKRNRHLQDPDLTCLLPGSWAVFLQSCEREGGERSRSVFCLAADIWAESWHPSFEMQAGHRTWWVGGMAERSPQETELQKLILWIVRKSVIMKLSTSPSKRTHSSVFLFCWSKNSRGH